MPLSFILSLFLWRKLKLSCVNEMNCVCVSVWRHILETECVLYLFITLFIVYIMKFYSTFEYFSIVFIAELYFKYRSVCFICVFVLLFSFLIARNSLLLQTLYLNNYSNKCTWRNTEVLHVIIFMYSYLYFYRSVIEFSTRTHFQWMISLWLKTLLDLRIPKKQRRRLI